MWTRGTKERLKGVKRHEEVLRGKEEGLTSDGMHYLGGGVAWKGYETALEGDKEVLNDGRSTLTDDGEVDRCYEKVLKTKGNR